MIRNLSLLASIGFLGCSLGACSNGAEIQTGSAAITPPPAQVAVAAAPAYQLSEKELKMNCKQLTGSMKVRLLQVHSSSSKTEGTLVARGLQTGAVKIWGGPTYGTDPSGDSARDLAQLEAYNQQLAAKKCKTLDLQAEFQTAATAPKVQ